MVEGLREDEKILFELSGNKMQGRYTLIKIGFVAHPHTDT